MVDFHEKFKCRLGQKNKFFLLFFWTLPLYMNTILEVFCFLCLCLCVCLRHCHRHGWCPPLSKNVWYVRSDMILGWIEGLDWKCWSNYVQTEFPFVDSAPPVGPFCGFGGVPVLRSYSSLSDPCLAAPRPSRNSSVLRNGKGGRPKIPKFSCFFKYDMMTMMMMTKQWVQNLHCRS